VGLTFLHAEDSGRKVHQTLIYCKESSNNPERSIN
jgi:hypothetical protein